MNQPEEQVLIEKYAKFVCNSERWIFTAKKLLASASLVEPEIIKRWKSIHDSIFKGESDNVNDEFSAHHFQSVYLMLVAYALENLMKGYLIDRDKESLRREILSKARLPSALVTHNLTTLASQCKLKMTVEEQVVFRRLSKHSNWIGRYPFAKNYRDFFHLSPMNKIPSTGIAWSSSEIEEIKQLVRKVCRKIGVKVSF